MRTIVTVNGWWSTNIGNSFFQISAEHILKTIFPDDTVVPIADLPGYWNVRQGTPANAYVPLQDVDADVVVFHGPIFRKEFDRIALNTMRTLHARGIKIVILATGLMHYDNTSLKYYEDWMAQLPIHVLTSRDSEAFRTVSKFAKYAYDGIDIAFWINEAYPAPRLTRDPFVVFNFDQITEPLVKEAHSGIAFDDTFLTFDLNIKWDSIYWRAKWVPFLEGLLHYNRRPQQNRILHYDILRTDHRFNPYLERKIYSGENTFAMDTPYGYLSMYANTRATFSNRVHATVATLAYGNEAMLFSRSPRAKLLERVGLANVKTKPVALNQDYLNDEKSRMIDFLQSTI